MVRPKKRTEPKVKLVLSIEPEEVGILRQLAEEAGYIAAIGSQKGQGNPSAAASAIARLAQNPRDRALLIALLKKDFLPS